MLHTQAAQCSESLVALSRYCGSLRLGMNSKRHVHTVMYELVGSMEAEPDHSEIAIT
jgi:hypothetical protein